MTREQFHKCMEYTSYVDIIRQLKQEYPWCVRVYSQGHYYHFKTPEYCIRLVHIGHSYYYRQYPLQASEIFDWKEPTQ